MANLHVFAILNQTAADSGIPPTSHPFRDLVLKEFLADEFTVELQHAWVTVYGLVAQTMIEASENLSLGRR